MPPKHADAIGYLNELANDVSEPWFSMTCDLAVASGSTALAPLDRDTLIALLANNASYLGRIPIIASSTTAVTSSTDFLEKLWGFTNFKLIGANLQAEFKKRITIIFGSNGSGKSSLCESLKLLASPEPPSRPLQNLRGASLTPTAFAYRFRSDTSDQQWKQVVGYGPKRSTIKYFDSGIAGKNVRTAVEPGRIVLLTPFRLDVFESAKTLTIELKTNVQQIIGTNTTNLELDLEACRTRFAAFTSRPLSTIDINSLHVLPAEIKVGEAFSELDLLNQKRTRKTELEKASSEEGFKLLKSEYRELQALLDTIGAFVQNATDLWALEPVEKAATLLEKQSRQISLAALLIPEKASLEQFIALLDAASPLCSLESADGQQCPLCRRVLTEHEVKLFKQYHELLSADLGKEIEVIRSELVRAQDLANSITKLNRHDWKNSATLAADLLDDVKATSDLIMPSCSTTVKPTADAERACNILRALLAENSILLEQKKAAIEAAETGHDTLRAQLQNIIGEIEPLEYGEAIAEYLLSLRAIDKLGNERASWLRVVASFTPLLKKITDAAKTAYGELVVADFENRLNDEYKSLAEKPMSAFGVALSQRGSEAAVTMVPQVGGRNLEEVLSEGEQKVHALALFMAELETCDQSVLVLDDPVSSFDYTYTANCCTRLRDFATTHPSHQIIVLTHNWEFFVQLQTTLNQSGLNGDLSVQILENCSTVADYSEKTDDLKADIAKVLATAGEPTKTVKEEMAGKMRRLIEAVVNTHVFNKQRHQYKQKNQPVSQFRDFTKVVPLLQSEATTLGDLYAKLSIPEHDDPRNAYVNTDKATFQSRYDDICRIESALIARK